MRIRLYAFWELLTGSFWFLPTLMMGAALTLAPVMLALDRRITQAPIEAMSWMFNSSADGARSVLSTIAGSMISVAGTTFSITIVALSLASSQLGPRLLRNFMRDRGNQVVLGTFVSVFTYCLLILRAIRSGDDSLFVPHLSVLFAVFQAIVGVGVLIYFFHHVSIMIQAQTVIANIGRELEGSIDRLVTTDKDKRAYEYELRKEQDIPEDFESNSAFVKTRVSGYLQAIDYEVMQKIATKKDLLLKLLYRPGDFIAKESEIVAIYPEQSLSDELTERIQEAFTVGPMRLRIQNAEYAVDQLVEIAVRALSPGINDPFTAIACIDQLGTALSSLAERRIPSGYYYDDAGDLRLISDTLTFTVIVNAAFDQIRQHGRTDMAVTFRLLEVIAIIIARATTQEQKDALIRQAEMIKRAADNTFAEGNDRRDIADHFEFIMANGQQ